jgi:hypothetical protein
MSGDKGVQRPLGTHIRVILARAHDPLGDDETDDMLRAADIPNDNNEAANDEMNVIGDRRRRLIKSFLLTCVIQICV